MVFLGSLGAIVLLGTLSLAVILAQVVALVLLGFAPIALVIGIFPGAGHDFFRGWLTKLATAVFIKALYSLVIAVVVAVAAALAAATGSLGFLFAFGLQTLFFWAIFIYRKQITARLVRATTGGEHHEHTPSRAVVQRGVNAATRPVTALVGVDAAARGSRQQESALSGSADHREEHDRHADSPTHRAVRARPQRRSAHVRAASPRRWQRRPRASHRHRTVAAPRRHRDAGAGPARRDGHRGRRRRQPRRDAAARRAPRPAEATPRSEHEDVMRRARELRERQREPVGTPRNRRG